MNLIQGETVTVVRGVETFDELGEPTGVTDEREDVENVVVAPGATADLDASRPEGVTVAFSLSFPKTYAGDLRGCKVVVRDDEYEVVGDPRRYTTANVPGDWDMTAEVSRVDG